MAGIVFRAVEVDGVATDVRVKGAGIVAVGAGVEAEDGDEIIEGNGGALLPGLHDHHLHLLAMAAAEQSICLGPPEVRDRSQFDAALRRAAATSAPGEWVRGVGYHASVAGELDRALLDAVVPDRCVRIQHRSGALWTLNSRALAALAIDSPTGRLFGADDVLRARLGDDRPPPLAPVGTRLSSYGVTGVTDATPSRDLRSIELIADAVAEGALPQSVVVMGSAELASALPVGGVRWGPVKLVIADHQLPSIDDVRQAILAAHRHGRPIAAHCVTAVALALALAAFDDVGVRPGDRIEHGAVISPDAAARIAELDLTVVTQPGFIATRGDQYLAEVDGLDLPHLYRCGSLLAHGIEVGGSTDAPFGHGDPWQAIKAAVDRCTESGVVLGENERLTPPRALALFLSPPERPGGDPRRVTVGAPADLCLLDEPLDAALATPSSAHVVATIVRGQVAYRR